MQCFRCHCTGHFSSQCPAAGKWRGGARKWIRDQDPYDVGVVGGGKRGRENPFIVGAKRSSAFTLGRSGFQNEGVYVLSMPSGNYYVGKSGNIEQRMQQHLTGSDEGAVCAKGFLHRIVPVTPRQEDLESWERAETLTLMHRHGVGKVRGWFYTSREMTQSQREHAFQQVCEKLDLCRACGYASHFASQCSAKGRASFACK